MLIKRRSLFSGITREKELDITEEQIHRWRKGELAQHVFAHLSDDDREFLMTGITKEEWDEEFGLAEIPDEY